MLVLFFNDWDFLTFLKHPKLIIQNRCIRQQISKYQIVNIIKMQRNLFNLPCVKTYNKSSNNYIPLETVEMFLGRTFFPRVNNIYTNFIEAIASRNYKYLHSIIQNQNLALLLQKECEAARDNRYRIKLHQASSSLTQKRETYEKYKKYLRLRETVWSNGATRIGLSCVVHFGKQFRKLKIKEQNQPQLQQTQQVKEIQGEAEELKCFRFSKRRHFYYSSKLGIIENLKQIYNHQTFEFILKISSKNYLQIFDYNNQPLQENEPEDQIITEIRLKCGNQKFNWVMTDVNGLSKQL